MMKMMILAPRRVGMSPAEFRHYLTAIHGPLVRSVPEVAAAIHHYHYNFPLPGVADLAFGHPPASHLDVVTQAWFDSREAQLANMAEPRYLSIVRPDEGRFANEAAATMHYTSEIAVVAGEVSDLKMFYFRRRRAGLSRAEFQAAWRTRFAEAMLAAPGLRAACSSYVQNQVLAESDHPDGMHSRYFDVIDELRLRDPAELRHLRADEVAWRGLRSLEAELLDESRTLALATETVRNIP